MSGFEIGDWIFIAFIMVVIVVCVAVSGMGKK
jgi:hypothetical protein